MKKATKIDIERRACSQKSHVPHTNSSMYFFSMYYVTQSLFRLGFSWSPDNIIASNKKRARKKEPRKKEPKKELSVSEMTIQYLPKTL